MNLKCNLSLSQLVFLLMSIKCVGIDDIVMPLYACIVNKVLLNLYMLVEGYRMMIIITINCLITI